MNTPCKPFDLEAAKNGAPVMTRDGRKARIVCFDRVHERLPLVVLVEHEGGEDPRTYTATGHYYDVQHTSDCDLVMAPVNRTGWINIYPGRNTAGDDNYHGWGGLIHKTRDEALAQRGSPDAITIQIEWTE